MATWGLHIRIAEGLLNRGYDFDEESFLVGNIGPDCGMPNEDWSKFEPPTEVSHWSDKGKKNIFADKFYNAYLDKEVNDRKEKSFLFGYYTHLLTDIEFKKLVSKKQKEDINYQRLKTDKKFIWTIKEDWYDLDHLYFRDNPESIFFRVFQNIKHFPDYLDYYPKGAIIQRIKYITKFYHNPSENLDREYKYLTKEEMNSFLDKTLDFIDNDLKLKLI
ncbi:zinc dependent phospholipase C family protein [Vallitalea guaymasensis]|uniref:zinc dependent phospholipase C family protein n=1 Tax=Vallitalea guaymasensis TaxID=1185412 RepID=UPI00272CBB57|nr:zinc dependent phospholipase C family protein [Vallitalea guaymasensis]